MEKKKLYIQIFQKIQIRKKIILNSLIKIFHKIRIIIIIFFKIIMLLIFYLISGCLLLFFILYFTAFLYFFLRMLLILILLSPELLSEVPPAIIVHILVLGTIILSSLFFWFLFVLWENKKRVLRFTSIVCRFFIFLYSLILAIILGVYDFEYGFEDTWWINFILLLFLYVKEFIYHEKKYADRPPIMDYLKYKNRLDYDSLNDLCLFLFLYMIYWWRNQ